MSYASAFIIAYLLVLFLYFFSETSESHARRAVNKIVLASLFFGYTVFAVLTNPPILSHRLLLALALLCAYLGDIALLWRFELGGKLFGAGNILFLLYELDLVYAAQLSPWLLLLAVPLFALLWGGIMTLFRRGKIDFGGIGIYPLYLGSVTVHGSIGLVLFFAGTGIPAVWYAGLGLLLVMISDYLLTLYQFKYKVKWLLRANSGTYFLGILLCALSLSPPL